MSDAQPSKASFNRTLAGYVLGSGALAVSQAAGAGVVYTDFGDVSVTDPDPVANGNSLPAFSIDLSWGSPGFGTVTTREWSGGVSPILNPYELVIRPADVYAPDGGPAVYFPTWYAGTGVAVNSKMAAGSTFDASTLPWNTDSGTLFGLGSDLVLGLRVADGIDYHYGWLRYTIGSVILHDMGFQTQANVGITAPSGVPAPASLALLASGVAGLAAVRRRRQKAA